MSIYLENPIVTFTWHFAWKGQIWCFPWKIALRSQQCILKVIGCWPSFDQNMWDIFFMLGFVRNIYIIIWYLEKLKFRLKLLNMVFSIKVTSRSQQCIMWSTGADLVLTKICGMYFSCQNASETYLWCSHIMKTHIVTFTWNFAWNGQNPIFFFIKMASRRH